MTENRERQWDDLSNTEKMNTKVDKATNLGQWCKVTKTKSNGDRTHYKSIQIKKVILTRTLRTMYKNVMMEST